MIMDAQVCESVRQGVARSYNIQTMVGGLYKRLVPFTYIFTVFLVNILFIFFIRISSSWANIMSYL